MLVTLSEILHKAEQGKYAVIAPDFTSMASIRFLLETAEDLKAPLILSYIDPFKPLCPVRSWQKWIDIIREECNQYNIDICLHLDHGATVEVCRQAVDAGFTGVMIDASEKSFSENVDLTSRVVEFAHAAGVSVEAEIGHVGTAEEGAYPANDAARARFTQPDQAEKFAQQTGVDGLAVAVGTVHGEYAGEPHIDFDLLDKINQRVLVPLVLHGGSGTGDQNIRQAVAHGIRKINMFSDWIIPAQREIARLININPKDIPRIATAQQTVIHDILAHWIQISGSAKQN
ncbi:MAG: class II fructose-bisphosphate aldolase [Anaerolineaceae bacterium]|nr:class II fructose-bisphosphate aldolase [Anaerolineaceae bacterium]